MGIAYLEQNKKMTIVIAYFAGLLIGSAITFIVLKSTNFEKLFHQGRVFEIRAAYFLLSLIGGHIVGLIFHKIFSLISTI